MTVSEALAAFVAAHRPCGELVGDASPASAEGYLVWVAPVWGAAVDQSITAREAAEDLVWSGLAVGEN